jgi:hypothetical protein
MTRFLVRARFSWPWGQPGVHDLGPFDRYLAELVTIDCAERPLTVVGVPPDEPWRSREWQVRVTSARMVAVG